MIAIIDYEAGNLTSVERAVRFIGFCGTVTNDPKIVAESERVIFPGVGAAGSAMDNLKRLGLDKAILKACDDGKPVLGICIGAQIVMGYSEENNTECLGIFEGGACAFPHNFTLSDGGRLKNTPYGLEPDHVKA